MTIKIKKRLGSDAVRDIVDDATAYVKQHKYRSIQDPWPDSRRIISNIIEK